MEIWSSEWFTVCKFCIQFCKILLYVSTLCLLPDMRNFEMLADIQTLCSLSGTICDESTLLFDTSTHFLSVTSRGGMEWHAYRWIGNYEELKSFIENAIKLSGTWSSPGGEINNFKAGDKFSIKWHRYKSKKIILSKDDNAELLSKNFKAFANLAWLLDLSSKPLNRRIRRVFLTFLYSFLVSKNILRQTNPMNAIAV